MVPRVCASRSYWAIHLAHGVSIAAVAWSGWLAWRTYARVGKRVPGEEGSAGDRERFLAVAGLMVSGFSLVSLAAHWIPSLVLGACQ